MHFNHMIKFQLARINCCRWNLLGPKIYIITKIINHNTNIYVKIMFSLRGKITAQTSNQFIIYQINYNNFCVYLTTKEKYLLFFFALIHTSYFSQRRQHFTFSFLFSFPCIALFCLSFFL